MAKKHHEWFIWAKNSHTNEVVAKMLNDIDNRFEENLLSDTLCEDGKTRHLWRVTEQNARILWLSRTDGDLKFEVFNRLGTGKIRNVTFLFRKEKKPASKEKVAKNVKN